MLENENDGTYPERIEPKEGGDIQSKPGEASKGKKKPKKSVPEVPPRDGLTPTEEGRVQQYRQMVGNYYGYRRKNPDDPRLFLVNRMIAVRKRELRGKPELNQARIADTRDIITNQRSGILEERTRRTREDDKLWTIWKTS